MNPHSFLDFFERYPCILSEGAVIERLRRDSNLDLDPFIVNSGFIYDQAPKAAIETIYRQYLDIGLQHQLPLLLSTPTWRANRERIQAAGYADRDVNGDNFRFERVAQRLRGLWHQGRNLWADELPRRCL